MSAPSQANREIELKLEYDLASGERLAAALAECAVQPIPPREKYVTPYFDTADLALRQAGISFRIRRHGAKRVQTIKSGRTSAGLFARQEWETELSGDEPDLAAARATGLSVFSADAAPELRPRFTIRVSRCRFLVHRDGAEIEAVLDEGRVVAGRRSKPIAELELELRKGPLHAIFDLAEELARVAPLSLGVLSKSERGYALIAPSSEVVVKSRHTVLDPGLTAAEAFQSVARECLLHLVANEPALRDAQEPGAVHQMRVAIRRLRAAMSIFRPILADADFDRVRNELKWFADALGETRDLDVFVQTVLAPLREKHADSRDLETLAEALERRRGRAYRAAREALGSARYRRAVLDALRWTETGAWTRDQARAELRDGLARDFAAKDLRRRRRRIARKGADPETMQPEPRHRLRIAVKKLRYAVEFLGGLFGHEKRRRRFSEALESLQERLGDLNDIAVAGSIVLGPKDAEAPAFAHAALRLVQEAQARDEKKLLAEAAKAHKVLSGAKPFWKA